MSLRLASRAFALAARARGAAYDIGALPVERVGGAAVLSVGNLRAGGSGKTPFALWLAAELAGSGVPTAIVLRGYGGSLSARGGVVSAGDGPLVTPREAGDEAHLLASRAPPGVAVHVGADRVAAARRAAAGGARAIVLDDGFQHRRLRRDCDIVLVCPEDVEPSTASLPLGPLRETAAALHRAHVVAGWEEEWRGRGDAPGLLLAASATGLWGPDLEVRPLPSPGRRAFLFAGIARPERFVRTARSAGFIVAGTRFFPDHHPYASRDLARIADDAGRSSAELLLTTEKDLVRIGRAADLPPFLALRIDVRVSKGGASLGARLRAAGLPPLSLGA